MLLRNIWKKPVPQRRNVVTTIHHFITRQPGESTTFAYDKFKNKGELIMTTKTFKVEGMKCSHCKAHVEEAIQALPGVEKAEAHLDAANVAVDFDAAKVSAEAIKKAVDEAGHYELILE
jgi:copper ion binding protein